MMGLGDEIMVTALARKNARNHNCVSVILNGRNQIRKHPAWDNNPNIKQLPDHRPIFIDNCMTIPSGDGAGRHYIDLEKSIPHKMWSFKKWDIEPGEIFLSETEQEYASSFNDNYGGFGDKPVVLLDNIVTSVHAINKQWPQHFWQEVSLRLYEAGAAPINLISPFNQARFTALPSCYMHSISGIRDFLTCVAGADLVICHEGGMHHAAAALGIPAIVIYGGFISPEITGYNLPTHFNLTHATEFCGNIQKCPHCAIELSRITPDEVLSKVSLL